MINILVAYPYMTNSVIKKLEEMKDNVRFLLDSGAFTAWKAKKTINLDDYCFFLEKLTIKPWRYFTLDVIGDSEKTQKNYEMMIKRGFNPIPIFTRGEDPVMLEEYYLTSDVVGIGGLVGTRQNKGFVNGIMKLIGDRKCHWLGFTQHDYLKKYKPHMCDSSSWLSARRYGVLSLYECSTGFIKIKRKLFIKKPSLMILQLISRMGIDPNELAKEKNWHGGFSASSKITAGSWLLYQKDAEKYLNTRLFLALTTADDMEILMLCFKMLKKVCLL